MVGYYLLEIERYEVFKSSFGFTTLKNFFIFIHLYDTNGIIKAIKSKILIKL